MYNKSFFIITKGMVRFVRISLTPYLRSMGQTYTLRAQDDKILRCTLQLYTDRLRNGVSQ